jgi:hypothetical protein
LRKSETSWVYVNLTLHLLEHVLSQFSSYELNEIWSPNDVNVMFILLNLLMNKNHGLRENSFLLTT